MLESTTQLAAPISAIHVGKSVVPAWRVGAAVDESGNTGISIRVTSVHVLACYVYDCCYASTTDFHRAGVADI